MKQQKIARTITKTTLMFMKVLIWKRNLFLDTYVQIKVAWTECYFQRNGNEWRYSGLSLDYTQTITWRSIKNNLLRMKEIYWNVCIACNNNSIVRSSHSHMFFKISIFKTFCKRPATLLKMYSNTGAFLWNLRNFWEHLRWLHLYTWVTLFCEFKNALTHFLLIFQRRI